MIPLQGRCPRLSCFAGLVLFLGASAQAAGTLVPFVPNADLALPLRARCAAYFARIQDKLPMRAAQAFATSMELIKNARRVKTATLLPYLEQVRDTFNQIHLHADIEAVIVTPKRSKPWPLGRKPQPELQITMKWSRVIDPSHVSQTPFERVLRNTLRRSPHLRIVFSPTHSESNLGSYEHGEGVLYLSAKDLLSIDTIPTIMFHEDTHALVLIAQGQRKEWVLPYLGEIHGTPPWAQSKYLKETKFLSLSETLTFWGSIKAQEFNLGQVLRRQVHESYSETAWREDLRLEARETLRVLLHHNRVGRDVVETYDRATRVVREDKWIDIEPYRGGLKRISIYVDASSGTGLSVFMKFDEKDFPKTWVMNAHIAEELVRRADAVQKQLDHSQRILDFMETHYEKDFAERFVYGNPEETPLTTPELIQLARVLANGQAP
ncbi:MAG TPA: hypothetical protein VM901_01085 [Bdellovibrionota bacterium]|jgi:hypothetical protein|nr:hypothetical protein [Bdellovibrionota bacterium]